MTDKWEARIGLTFTRDTADAIRKAIADERTQALNEAKQVIADLRFTSGPKSRYRYEDFRAWDNALTVAAETLEKLKTQAGKEPNDDKSPSQ